jgi:hypothetical protein
MRGRSEAERGAGQLFVDSLTCTVSVRGGQHRTLFSASPWCCVFSGSRLARVFGVVVLRLYTTPFFALESYEHFLLACRIPYCTHFQDTRTRGDGVYSIADDEFWVARSVAANRH